MPPTINKYYALDLAKDRSLVEFLVQGRSAGVRDVLAQPGRRGTRTGTSTRYVQAILDALDAVERISGVERTALAGICSGGILASMTAAYLSSTGQQDRLAAFGLAVTVIDSAARRSRLGAQQTAGRPRAAKALSKRRGYLDGRALAEVFAWLRPGDLVWNYWVNNYLLGKKPPAFDILFWNADTTRMTAGLHADFVDLALDNLLAQPGAITVLGVPIDLSQHPDRQPTSSPASPTTSRRGRTATAPRSCSAARRASSCRRAGTSPRSSTRPATRSRASRLNKDNPADPAEWLRTAETQTGHVVDATCRPGSLIAAARSSRHRRSSAAAGFAPSSPRPAPTSSTS